MNTRMTQRMVVFRHAFVLGGFERIAPAGSYLVETEEEEIDGLSMDRIVWRRMATIIHLFQDGATEYVKIDAGDLDKALARDAEKQEPPAALTARLDAERKRINARVIRRKKF
jgi:hypothetical protein